MKKIILLLFIIFSIIGFSGAYIKSGEVYANLYGMTHSQDVIIIGVKHEFDFNNYLKWGFDSSYISTGFKNNEEGTGFDLGYGSYDIYLKFIFDNFVVQIKHNCTHRFESTKSNLFWSDMAENSIYFEWLF